MIKKLKHSETAIAQEIRSVFQDSYAVEAELLNAIDFPPLKRPLEAFVDCPNVFYGFHKDGELAGVTEIATEGSATHIQSLVVHPKFFRLGIAGKMLEYVFNAYHSELFTVETGADNGPARKLYEKFGFAIVKEWDTDHGIRKVRFEK
ncbi:N-acetyltransferase [Aureisphaera galaxeae]|uniref:GNAT family N-acetyltransferase n=1 Tax=Aureisphaera galaxeae TaxID=1538023 RepID=UPI002350F816|nr:N-acetyltransferase [Aureisphaera galaxeae]MDC8003726.1 N-acetyltransferase [Aureisphaera galaxeae]